MEYCNERGRQLSLQQFNCQRLINRFLKLNLLVNDKSTHKIPPQNVSLLYITLH